MRPAPFDYVAPTSLAQAAAMLATSDDEARILAGGQSLMAAMNLRLARPSILIDIGRIEGLDSISIEDKVIRLGPMVRHCDIVNSPRLAECVPLLQMAGRHIAHATIREHGTIGGSMALADPASEWATALTLLGGRVKAISTHGERWIDIGDFYVSFYTTALEADEILAEIEIRIPDRTRLFAFEEFSRQQGAFAIAMTAIAMTTDPDGRKTLDVVLGGCGPTPVRLDLSGHDVQAITSDAIETAFDSAEPSPLSDVHASAADRRSIASSLVRRSIRTLSQRPE